MSYETMTALKTQSAYCHSVGDEPLPGYRLVAPLGRGGFGEVWKCVAPGGLHKAIKFVSDDGQTSGLNSRGQEYEAFQRVKGIRHPFLLTLERVELIGDELVMVMELADRNLAQRFDECRANGRAGIPRSELLAYMVDAAEALDVLSREHGLQHLDVKPANLFLLGGHAKVGDYGLVARCLTGQDGLEQGRGLTPRYVAPEVIDGRVDSRSDQYPLALVYQELLTGVLPFRGPTVQHYLEQHRGADPDLTPLPQTDRAVVQKALAKTPAHRYTSCLAFVKELMREGAVATPIPSRSSAALAIAALSRLTTPTPDSSVEATVRLTQVASGSRSVSATTLRRTTDEFSHSCPGHQLVSELGYGPRGRVVRTTDANGQSATVTLLRLDGGTTAELEHTLRAAALPHPRLWQTIAATHPRSVAFITPDTYVPIHEWLRKRAAGTPTPLRPADVVRLLASVATAVDELTHRAGFPHLLISPHTILTGPDAWGVTGYGCAELLRISRPDTDWLTDDPFVAPEAVAGNPGSRSDVYSLALVYVKLVGGWQQAKRGHNDRAVVDWAVLSPVERDAVRRAVAHDPNDRFASCGEFLAAVTPPTPNGPMLDDLRLVESVARLTGEPTPTPVACNPAGFVENVVKAATAGGDQPDSGARPYTLPDGRVALRFPIQWTTGFGKLKSDAFKDQYRYSVTPLATDTTLLKPKSTLPGGKIPPVELVVRWPVLAEAGMGEVVVTGRYMSGLDPRRGVDQVITVLDLFRRSVQNTSDHRRAARVRTEFTVVLYPVGEDLQLGTPIRGKCKDVSLTGFAAVFPGDGMSGHVFVAFPDVPATGNHAVLAKLVRTEKRDALAETLLAGRFVHAGDGQ